MAAIAVSPMICKGMARFLARFTFLAPTKDESTRWFQNNPIKFLLLPWFIQPEHHTLIIAHEKLVLRRVTCVYFRSTCV